MYGKQILTTVLGVDYFRMANRVFLLRVLSASRQLQSRAMISSLTRLSTTGGRKQNPAVLQGLPRLQTDVRSLCSKLNTDFIVNIQDEQDFQKKVVQSSVPVVVDFHAK